MNVARFAIFFIAILHSKAVFETDFFPGEGRPVFEASANELSLHELPSTASRVAKTITVLPTQRLSYDDSRYQTIRAGRIRVLLPAYIEGRLIGNVTRLSRDKYYSENLSAAKTELKPGKMVEYLQDRAEGSCLVRVDGRIIDASPCPSIDTAHFRVVAAPLNEGWIHIVSGNFPGWLLISEQSVALVDREF